MTQLDFNDLADSPLYRVSVTAGQTLQEMESALRIQEAEATQERRLEMIKLYTMIVSILTGASFCMAVYFLGTSLEDKRWALGILQAVFTGSVFYGIGQKSAK